MESSNGQRGQSLFDHSSIGRGGLGTETPSDSTTSPEAPDFEAVTGSMIKALIESQDYKCALTGEQLTPETATLDHIVPLSQGGEHCIANIWAVTDDVNRLKGVLAMERLVELCTKVVGRHGKIGS